MVQNFSFNTPEAGGGETRVSLIKVCSCFFVFCLLFFSGLGLAWAIFFLHKIDYDREKEHLAYSVSQLKKEVKLEYEPVSWKFTEGLSPVGEHELFGYVNTKGKLVIPCEYATAEPFSEGLAAVGDGEKYGFVNDKGSMIIPLSYDSAYCFSEGLAAVKQDRKWGYIDKAGHKVIPCEYDVAFRFVEGLAAVKQNGKWGYIDKTGRRVVPCEYDFAYPFVDGLAVVQKGQKFGYVDKVGKLVIPCKYWTASDFSDGFAGVKETVVSGHKYVDRKGRTLISCDKDVCYPFSEGLALVGKKDMQSEDKYGYIDRQGKQVIPCQYDWAMSFYEGLAGVQKGTKCGYIDKRGQLVIPCKYDALRRFSEGLAFVGQGEKWGVIDKSGNLLVPYKYEFVEDFSEGYAIVSLGDDYFILADPLHVAELNKELSLLNEKSFLSVIAPKSTREVIFYCVALLMMTIGIILYVKTRRRMCRADVPKRYRRVFMFLEIAFVVIFILNISIYAFFLHLDMYSTSTMKSPAIEEKEQVQPGIDSLATDSPTAEGAADTTLDGERIIPYKSSSKAVN